MPGIKKATRKVERGDIQTTKPGDRASAWKRPDTYQDGAVRINKRFHAYNRKSAQEPDRCGGDAIAGGSSATKF